MDGKENLLSQLVDRKMTFSDIERRIKEIVAPLSTLFKSVDPVSERT